MATVTGTIKAETDKAVLFEHGNGSTWVPLSLIDKIKRTKTKGTDEIVVEDWFAEKEEMENA